MNTTDISITAREFGLLFPFHLAVDSSLRIIQVGHALQRVAASELVGGALSDHLLIRRPHNVATYDGICQQTHSLFIAELRSTGLTLKGQFLQLERQPALVFLCTPWVTSLAQIQELGLSLSDFPVYDPIADLLTLFQAQQTALKDSQRLTLQLTTQRAELQASTMRLATLIESMQAGVLVEDEQRRIVLVNRRFCSLFGIPADPELLSGADCSESAEQSKHLFCDPDLFVARVDQLLADRAIVSGEALELRDGRTFERDYVPIYVDQVYRGHLWQYRDVSDRRQVEAALAQARDAALESARLKSEFIATVSHEIRTPLNGVIGMSELLLNMSLSDSQHELAQIINDSSNTLLFMINDLLDFSKIEAGKLELVEETLDLHALLQGVANMTRISLREKPVTLSVSVDPGLPSALLGDAGRLQQVLLNLVGNAIKFTSRGEIIIRARAAAIEGGHVCVYVSVADTGIGISAENQRQIFQPFVQADGSITREYGGTGLGLAISKRLIELMHGEIGCESSEGVGSTFWFTAQLALAAPVAQPPQASSAQVAQDARPIARANLLVVEDNPVNQQLAVRQLERLGYTARVAANGREAVEIIESGAAKYDCILMDHHMPEMDGLAATAAIRAIERGRGGHIPIIAMTASALPAERDASMRAGMDDFLSKPVRQADLRATLDRWLVPPEPAPPPLDQRHAHVDLDQQMIQELRMLDTFEPGMFAGLVRVFAGEFHDQMQRIESALAIGDPHPIAQAAHRLRGASSNLGAAQFGEICLALERAARQIDLTQAQALLAQLRPVAAASLAALCAAAEIPDREAALLSHA